MRELALALATCLRNSAVDSHAPYNKDSEIPTTVHSGCPASQLHLVQWLTDFETRQASKFQVLEEQIMNLQADIAALRSSGPGLSDSEPAQDGLEDSQLEALSTESVIARGVMAGWRESLE